MYQKERFQAGKYMAPRNSVSAQDLTQAAATSVGIWRIPTWWGGALLKAFGFHLGSAAGSVTTGATVKMQVGGSDVVDVNSNVLLTSAIVANQAINSCVEKEANQADTSKYRPAPVYQKVTPNQKIEMIIVTQGVAGTQSAWPYIIVSQDPDPATDEVRPS